MSFNEAFGNQREREEINFESRIKQVATFDELFDCLFDIGPIHGSHDIYTPDHLIDIIERVRTGELTLNYVTRTHGLRETVQRLLNQTSSTDTPPPLEAHAALELPIDTTEEQSAQQENISPKTPIPPAPDTDESVKALYSESVMDGEPDPRLQDDLPEKSDSFERKQIAEKVLDKIIEGEGSFLTSEEWEIFSSVFPTEDDYLGSRNRFSYPKIGESGVEIKESDGSVVIEGKLIWAGKGLAVIATPTGLRAFPAEDFIVWKGRSYKEATERRGGLNRNMQQMQQPYT